MTRIMLLVMMLTGCSFTARVPDVTARGDSVAVVMAAFERHYPKITIDSVAFDIEGRTPAEEALVRKIAALMGRPVVLGSDLILCTDEESPIPWPTCEIVGFRRVIGFWIEAVDKGRALIWIGSSHDSMSESGRHVWGEATLYELRYRNGEWVVVKALQSVAT